MCLLSEIFKTGNWGVTEREREREREIERESEREERHKSIIQVPSTNRK